MDCPSLLKTYKQGNLWPPIHSAVDVLLKRHAASAEPYELTWRLIHVWECVAISLSEAVIARWISLGRMTELVLAREKAYGRSWNESEARLETRVGAFDGSVDKWIEIIDYIARTDPGDSEFLGSVVRFLGSDSGKEPTKPPVDLAPFLTAWGRACDVTQGLTSGPTSVRHAMKAINSFRNRFAHVPFPYDPMEEIHRQLLACTEQLFSAPPSPLEEGGAMAGAVSRGQFLIKGSSVIPNPLEAESNGVSFIFGLKKNTAVESWPVSLFVHLDQMLRPYVLTRLKNDQGLWEYTRYLAESNAVLAVRSEELLRLFPIPDEKEYRARPDQGGSDDEAAGSDDAVHQPNSVSTMSEAIAAIQERRFEPAIEYFVGVTTRRAAYHVGWLRLGHARRELAVERLGQDSGMNIDDLLSGSLEALGRATDHRDPSYQAEAHYQLSKTYYRRWRLKQDEVDLSHALEEAVEARGIYPEAKYDSWLEYLQTFRR